MLPAVTERSQVRLLDVLSRPAPVLRLLQLGMLVALFDCACSLAAPAGIDPSLASAFAPPRELARNWPL